MAANSEFHGYFSSSLGSTTLEDEAGSSSSLEEMTGLSSLLALVEEAGRSKDSWVEGVPEEDVPPVEEVLVPAQEDTNKAKNERDTNTGSFFIRITS